MVTPPNPGFQLDALSIFRRLSWSLIEGDVGELVGGWIAIAATSSARVEWCAGGGHAPSGLMPRYVSRDAFIALRDGRPLQGGMIYWQGQRWTLADVAEGERLVVRLVAEGSAV